MSEVERIQHDKEEEVKFSGRYVCCALQDARCKGAILEGTISKPNEGLLDATIEAHKKVVEILEKFKSQEARSDAYKILLSETADRLQWAEKEAGRCNHNEPTSITVQYPM
jgi:hypothetical protein